MNILTAADDVRTRLLLGSALKKLGHSVQEAKNGSEAWQAWLGALTAFREALACRAARQEDFGRHTALSK